ncbi:hypothetical protein GUITHDRAFT_138051 [Guillardia theta CCMP2712]|uniref:Uncharacterized protein n=1 Tax=Guillardia theta (strain CCMP2712) TaxID=905079 RepID=L1JEW0_GUITC|nr:hypothetical protein GUITHDRAFT_138051 [Guillardia theta CCMP2712]EKX46674.1 hypothetical protein GUITHDRAFT_138051 [Guillardia theta CCMP2712]|eukprot:XP_005833654.1 hypothetical protein GUITHDRAFT_138051 [Guillardia theta CCMP2712]
MAEDNALRSANSGFFIGSSMDEASKKMDFEPKFTLEYDEESKVLRKDKKIPMDQPRENFLASQLSLQLSLPLAGMNQRIFSAEMQLLRGHLRHDQLHHTARTKDRHRDHRRPQDSRRDRFHQAIHGHQACRHPLITADKDNRWSGWEHGNESKKDRDAGKVTKTELQYQPPKKAAPPKFALPPKEPAAGKSKK